MARLRRELWTSVTGTLGMLAPIALGLIGCPQLLADDFINGLPSDPDGDVPETPLPGVGGGTGTADAGSSGTTGPLADSGVPGPVPPPGPAGPTPPAPAPPHSGPAACVPATESCDGRDNDCDELIDEATACTSDCTGLLLEGRSAMFCVGAGTTFASAEARCSVQGMRPVVIESAQKSAAVLQAVEPLYAALTTISEDQHSIWVDAHDGETEGTWHWGSSGTVFWIGDATGSAQNGAYVDWASGKPNNSGTGDGEDCAVMHAGTGPDPLGTWNDETCAGLHAFLCEAPLP